MNERKLCILWIIPGTAIFQLLNGIFILILTAARQKAWVTKQAQSVLCVLGPLTHMSWVWPWQRSGKAGHYGKSCVSKKAESFPWITLEKGQEEKWTEKIGLFNPWKISHYSGNERRGCYGGHGVYLTQQSRIHASLLRCHIFSWALDILQTSVDVSAVPRKHIPTLPPLMDQGQGELSAVSRAVKAAAQGEGLMSAFLSSHSPQQLSPQKPVNFLSCRVNFTPPQIAALLMAFCCQPPSMSYFSLSFCVFVTPQSA